MASSRKLRSGELPARLADFFKQVIRPGSTLLLGLSGGLDSCVLLDLLHGLQAKLGFRLQALHVNHGISPNAIAWEEFCAGLCASLAVPFQAVRVQVARDSGLGLEAAAREVRYTVLLAQPVNAVVLAHHRDDQAETLLLQLLRGAGTRGLAAMPPASESSGGQPVLLRPLLDVSREMLEDYAYDRHLSWIEDESNLDLAFDRNFLRHCVFPQLEQRFPAARTTLARAAGHLAEADALLQEVAASDATRFVHDGRLEIAGLASVSSPRAKNLLRYWLGGHGADVSSRRLQEIFRQLLNAGSDTQVRIVVPGGAVRRYRGYACFETKPGSDSGIGEIPWRGEAELLFGGGRLRLSPSHGQGLSLARVQQGQLWLRPRQGGERLRPDRARPARSLKYLFQQAGWPSWQRQLPLLYVDHTLVAVPGIGVACDWQAVAGEAGLEIEWQPAY